MLIGGTGVGVAVGFGVGVGLGFGVGVGLGVGVGVGLGVGVGVPLQLTEHHPPAACEVAGIANNKLTTIARLINDLSFMQSSSY